MSQKPILVVLGQKGIGKSYLINKLFNENLPVSHVGSHVTRQQIFKVKDDHQYFGGFVDTVGLDADPDNFMSVSNFYGRPLVVLYLNNDLRIHTSLQNIKERLEIDPSKIWVFNAHAFKDIPDGFPKDTQYEDIFDKKSQLATADRIIMIKAPVLPPISTPPMIVHVPDPRQQEKKSVPQPQGPTKAQKFLAEFPHVRDRGRAMRGMNTEKFNVKKEFKSISSAEVTQYRKIGDALLSLLLETMAAKNLLSTSQVNEVQTNDALDRFFRHILGREASMQIARLFPTASPESVSSESVGDVVEATLGKSYSLRLFDELLRFVLY